MFDVKTIVIIVVVAVVAWFGYEKFIKK